MSINGEDTIPRETGKLWGALREIRAWMEGKVREFEVILFGADGDNGMRGTIRELKDDRDKTDMKLEEVDKKVDAAVAWGKHLWEVERHQPGQCIGRAAVEALEKRLAEATATQEKDRRDMRKTRNAMLVAFCGMMVSSATAIVVALINRQH